MTALATESAPLDTLPFLVTSRARVLTGTSGAITAAGTKQKGITVTKTAAETGRYTVQAVDGAGSSIAFSKVMKINVTMISPTADAAITTGAATDWTIRGFNEATGVFYIQFYTQSATIVDTTITVANTDAELENNSLFLVEVVSERNGVSP